VKFKIVGPEYCRGILISRGITFGFYKEKYLNFRQMKLENLKPHF